jgi:hypothetical protein
LAFKTNPKQKQYWRDVEALSAYEPRKQALRWLLEGNPEAYIKWAGSDGHVAAYGKAPPPAHPAARSAPLFREIPLDRALDERHENAFLVDKAGKNLRSPAEKEAAFQAHKATHAKIEHLYSTPLQFLVEAGSVEALDAALALWSSPAERFARGFEEPEYGWNFVTKTLEPDRIFAAMRRLPLWLLAFALLLGRFEHADAMVRHGYGTDDVWVWDEWRVAIWKLKDRRDALRDILGAEPLVDEACEWVRNRQQALNELDKAMEAKEWTPEASAKAMELLDRNVAPGPDHLAAATEHGDRELLLKMFAQGGDPNCRYKTGVPMLARMDSKELTPELLQIWLDAGARPTMGPHADEPFGHGMCPSALYQWVWEGATELVIQACSKAADPVELRLSSDGKPWSPLLALALSRGHRELVRWMIEEKGCSLEDLADDGESPCSEYGAQETKDFAFAMQERRELMSDPAPSTAPPPGYVGNRL